MKYGFKSLCIFVLAMRKCCHFLLVFVLFACEEKSNEDAEEFQNSTEITISTIPDSVKRNFNEHLRYTLQSAFQISLDEKYTSQVVETDFNGDFRALINDILQHAIENEEYELAAIIRDELNK